MDLYQLKKGQRVRTVDGALVEVPESDNAHPRWFVAWGRLLQEHPGHLLCA